jgi:autotransporter-associated beta strand protein
LLSGNTALNFQGIGSLTLGFNNTYTGGTTIGAGNITSASGLFTPLGTLTVSQYNGLGTGPVTLAGGILNLNSPAAGEEVISNQLVLLYGPGSGYNVTVAATDNLGGTNTTSQIAVASGATNTYAALNNLTVNAPVFNVGATTNGLLIAGTTTLAGDTTFNNAGNLLLAGKVVGSGVYNPVVTKIGAGNLIVANIAAGAANANGVSAWNALQGTMEVRLGNGDISNPLGTGTTVALNGGVTFNVRHDGNSLTNMEVLGTFASNNLQIGSTAPAVSAGFIPSANVTLSLDRQGTIATNKTVQFGTLRFGGALGTPVLTQNISISFNSEFTGGLAMLGRDAVLNVNGGTVNAGWEHHRKWNVREAGFSGELDINTNGTGNTATGGLVLAELGIRISRATRVWCAR